MKQTNQSAKVFTYRMFTIVSMLGCIKFTLLCLITLIFVSCCHDVPVSYSNTAGGKKRKHSLDDDSNGFNCADHDAFDQYSLSASGSGSHQRSCCCKCNCLLCPFVFFSIFASFAALFALASLGFYLVSAYHFKLNYLIHDPVYMPDYVTKAYQFNPWLFDVYTFDASFYTLIAACLLYSVALISAISISCRIQMSPAWRRRYADSYEVLEMHDIMHAGGGSGATGGGKRKQVSGKNTYKKLNQTDGKALVVTAGVDVNAGGGGGDEKKKSSSSSSSKKKPIEMAKAVPESDDISLYDEAQTLTSPKTRIENSYE